MKNPKLTEAVALIKAGDKQTAQELLIEIIKADSQSKDAETAWYGLSTIAETPDKKRQCLQAILKINPDNQKAISRLEKLDNNEARVLSTQNQQSSPRTQSPPSDYSRVSDQQLLNEYIATRTRKKWQIISQTSTSVQLRKPKQWSTTLLVLGGVFLLLFGLGLIFWILAVIDYAIKKEQMLYVTVDELRVGTDEKPVSSIKTALIIVAVMIGVLFLCSIISSISMGSQF